jgi:pyruvate dehydrogenase E2 component (dihydrolipoamide acetyltransferase)
LDETRVAATPYARRRAAELGIDLSQIATTQPGHPVSAADVERRRAPERAPADQATAMRRAIANLMARSKREIPHYYLEDDVDLTHTLHWLGELNAASTVESRVLPAALFCKAVALTAHAAPALNGFWLDTEFRRSERVHLGVAIALRDGGLVAPAIHDADRLSLSDLMRALRDLTMRARGGRLRGSEMTDATLTVTILGDQGVRAVHGVIYPPQVALVGFGKVIERAWDSGGGIGLRPVVTVTLAADHRATDGHIGGRFLADVGRRLHHPEELR